MICFIMKDIFVLRLPYSHDVYMVTKSYTNHIAVRRKLYTRFRDVD
jgi:hypothetical protein